ncbi:MAG: phage tail protein [Achromobacter piechaudii]
MGRLLTLRRNLARLLTRNEVDDNFVNVATDFTGSVDPATLEDAYILPYMRWADTGTGWVRRRNGKNDGWTNEQRLHRASLAVFEADEVPNENVGPICIVGKGYAEWDDVGGGYRMQSGRPVGTPNWWPQRSSVPSGQIPLDGQTVSRATFPDLAALALAGHVPVVSEADWSADPTKRGAYTLGDGSTTIRVPDYNGKSAGALGAVFRRGDGTLSGGVEGTIQRDALQNIVGGFDPGSAASQSRLLGLQETTGPFRKIFGPAVSLIPQATAYTSNNYILGVDFDASRVARTSSETRALNVGGVWTVHAFGAMVNPGSVDAAQLASDYAVLNAGVQTLNGQVSILEGQMFGRGQSWQNVTANRAANGTTYTNSTGRPIIVAINHTAAGENISYVINVDSIMVARPVWPGSYNGGGIAVSFVVPPGSTYTVSGTGLASLTWREYR